MNGHSSLERRVADHYASEPPLRAPDRLLHAALATIDTTRQRRGLLAPWRFQLMSTNMKLAAALAVAIVLGAGVVRLLASPEGPDVGATATPSATRTASAPTPVMPTAVPPSAPPLTGTYFSAVYGLRVSYPDGWRLNRTGAEPWDLHALPGWGSPLGTADSIGYPAAPDSLFIVLSSHVLDASESGSAWAEDLNTEADPGPCETFETIVVAGLEGRLYSCNEPLRALFWSDDQGFLVAVHRSRDVSWYAETFDTNWFKDLLATVAFQ